MAENKDYVTRAEGNGMINISEDVISVIACTAVLDTEGVAGISAPSGKDFSDLLGKKTGTKGIRITVNEEGVSIDISVCIRYGCIINEVACEIQENVISAVESTTGLTVKNVNISVSSISFEKTK